MKLAIEYQLSMPLFMELVTDIEQDICLILLNGELDASSSILVDKALQAAMEKKMKHILVNFSLLNYISAAGIGVFISHLHAIQTKEITLVLFDMNSKVRNIFTVTGLDELIPIVASIDEAHMLCTQKTCK
jgi:anti-sigma B factor antagonist